MAQPGVLTLSLVLVISMYGSLGHEEQTPKFLATDELYKLVAKHTVPYLEMKMKREQLADQSAKELFGTIDALTEPLSKAQSNLDITLNAASKRTRQLSQMFSTVNTHLSSSMEAITMLKTKCPANVAFGPLEEGAPFLMNAEDQEDLTTVVAGEEESFPVEVPAEPFLTTGAQERLDAIRQEFGPNSAITLEDAMNVFSMSAQMCDRSAATRLAHYLAKATKFTSKLKDQLDRLERLTVTSDSIKELLKTFDSQVAIDMLTNVHHIKQTVSSMVCA